ncbi:AN1-type zinc finger protein 3 isoform X3 [Myotis myotis]|uniref:AN1-type zinc finger protein 3 isoform X3 n=1 Tax=Myotis myotis TaxID=51298 RepID=UPI00174EAFF7|nr:AN1-type zinc finger protein 3 isoform X3 [Myotis myotis]
MGDAGSERSKAPSLPPRCPCGFWGSSKTMNLCSKCFADFQKKQPDDDSAPSTSNSQSDLFSEETTSDNNNTSITTPTLSPSQQPLPTELNVTSPSKEECGPCTDTAHVSLITPTKRSCGTGMEPAIQESNHDLMGRCSTTEPHRPGDQSSFLFCLFCFISRPYFKSKILLYVLVENNSYRDFTSLPSEKKKYSYFLSSSLHFYSYK